jgi:plasmid stabilization system protein ParE
MSEVRFSTAAQSDLLDIVVFIARDNPRAAEDWLAAIEERCRLLADHPLTGERLAKCIAARTHSAYQPGRLPGDFRVLTLRNLISGRASRLCFQRLSVPFIAIQPCR